MRIISGECRSTSSLNTRCNFYNYGAALVADYWTALNSNRLQQEDCNNSQGTDWVYNEKFLKDCPLSVPQEWMTQAPVRIDDFSGVDSLVDAPEFDLNVSGINLDVEQLWSKNYVTLPGTYSILANVIYVTQRVLSSSAMGVDIM